MTRLLLLRARWRVWRGRCPKCNSKSYVCEVCQEYGQHDEPLTALTKYEWFRKYKEGLRCR